MAQGDAHVHNNFKEGILNGVFNLSTNTLKIALHSDAYATTQIDGSTAWSNTNEISISGYTTGGATLTGQAVTQDDTNDKAKFDANDVTWAGLGATTISRAILYSSTASNHIILIWENTVNSNGGDYTLSFDGTNGILTVA